jgi:hypothetical protein
MMITMRSFIFTIGFMFLLLALAGCDKNEAATTQNALAGGKSNAELFQEAVNAMSEATSYSIEAARVAPDMSHKLSADLELEKRTWSIKVEAYGVNARLIMKHIYLYTSFDDGKRWTLHSRSGDGTGGVPELLGPFNQIEPMWLSLPEDEVDKAKGHLSDGSPAIEQIDGVSTRHMVSDIKDLPTFATVIGGDAVDEGVIDIWVSKDTPHYVLQMKEEGKLGGKDVRADIKWSNFNKEFNIQAPRGQNER